MRRGIRGHPLLVQAFCFASCGRHVRLARGHRGGNALRRFLCRRPHERLQLLLDAEQLTESRLFARPGTDTIIVTSIAHLIQRSIVYARVVPGGWAKIRVQPVGEDEPVGRKPQGRGLFRPRRLQGECDGERDQAGRTPRSGAAFGVPYSGARRGSAPNQ